MRMRGVLQLLFVIAVVFALGSPREALAQPSGPACVAAFEKGQEDRQKGSLAEAMREFETCGNDACPDLTKGDCVKWLAEVDALMPTLSVVVQDDDGNDLASAKSYVDGELVKDGLDGKAIPVNPGKHALRVVVAGKPESKAELVVREGEKARRVEFRMSDAPAERAGGGSISPATWVLGGIGAASLVGFAIAGGIGLAEKSDATCAPNCSDAEVDSIRTKFIAADVLLAVGLTTLAAGVVIGIVSYATSSDDGEAKRARLVLVGGPANAAIAFTYEF